MNKTAQYVSASVFLSIVIKGFFRELTMVDSVILSATVAVYCMYEFLTETTIRKEFEEYKKNTDNQILVLEQKFQGVRDNVSKMSTAQSLRR